ncbi:hypothetical protein GCM10009564_19080 [Streptomyces thermogriseus]|uniref:Uncharacterized protein n=1 Tax=Streptomyces thermogriseus TaxID=75292 RepID=A0ABN1SXT8_9ACTN
MFSQSGAGSPVSNEEENSRSAAGGLAGRATAAPCEPAAMTKAVVRTTAGPHLCRDLRCMRNAPPCGAAASDNVVNSVRKDQ